MNWLILNLTKSASTLSDFKFRNQTIYRFVTDVFFMSLTIFLQNRCQFQIHIGRFWCAELVLLKHLKYTPTLIWGRVWQANRAGVSPSRYTKDLTLWYFFFARPLFTSSAVLRVLSVPIPPYDRPAGKNLQPETLMISTSSPDVTPPPHPLATHVCF